MSGGITLKAVVLVSGGMDSCTVATYAMKKYGQVRALSFRYGSKHEDAESKAAAAVCRHLGLEQQMIGIPHIFHGSALTDGGPLPTGRAFEDMNGIAPSYVPARNSVFLALAAAVAESWEATAICYGAHLEDHVGYPDCRPEYVEAISHALALGTANGVLVDAPFIHKEKCDIVKAAKEFGAPLHLTHSCYQGVQPACGVCDTCLIRIKAFKEAGLIDPISYALPVEWANCVPFQVR